MYPLAGAIRIKMQEDLFRNVKHEIVLEVSKVTICRHMKRKVKTLFDKEKYLMTNQALARRDKKLFCKKSNGKTSHSTIH